MRRVLAFLLLHVSSVAVAQGSALLDTPTVTCAAGDECVQEDELKTLLELAEWQKCRAVTAPKVKIDPVTIVLDRYGRIFGSGAGKKPQNLQIEWCNYSIDAEADVVLETAQHIDDDWGFGLRVKAGIGFLITDIARGRKGASTLDGGFVMEPFHYHFVNVDAYFGVRSFGVGVGVDVTQNFGVSVFYTETWGSLRANALTAGYFAF